MKREPHHLASAKPTRDIRERSFEFAVRIVKLCRHLEKASSVSGSLTKQLLRAGASAGANL